MLTDLFSSLDGAYSPMLWWPTLFLTLTWMTQDRVSSISAVIINAGTSLWGEKNLLRYSPFKLLLTALFLLLLMTNFLGLTPFTYSLASDLFTMSGLGALMWLLILMSGWLSNPKQSAAHLAPSGAPLGLLPFLVLIETISILIRPLTLTVRLMANISAGHIVLGLLANSLTIMVGHSSLVPVLAINVGYMLFEFFVCIIQAYIFTLLISLYQSEHP